MSKRVLCVIRTSTIKQEVVSQHNDMIGFLLSKGYKAEEIEWLESKGASARCANKAYLDMLDSIKSIITTTPTINACAVWHLNRLGRQESYITSMKEWFINNKVQLYVKNPELTLLNPDGSYNTGNNIVFAVFAATIPAETDEMMEKLKRGKKRSRELGKFNGGHTPFGFDNKDGYLVPNEEQMSIVRTVYKEYATGCYSYYKLCAELESRGITFSDRNLQFILQNERYRPYVGDDLWYRCNEVRTNNKMHFYTRESKYCRLGLGIIKCGYCGHNFISEGRDYVCYGKKMSYRLKSRCESSVRVNCDVVDTILWDIAALYHMKFIMTIDKTSIENYEEKKSIIKTKIDKLTGDIEKSATKIDRIKELYMDGDITRKQYNDKLNAVTKDNEKCKVEVDILRQEIKDIEETIETLKNPNIKAQIELLSKVGSVAHREEMRVLVRKYIVSVVISDMTYNNRSCTLLTVTTKDGKESRFIYDRNGSKKKGIKRLDKVYRITSNGIFKYSYTGKSMAELSTEQLEGVLDKI